MIMWMCGGKLNYRELDGSGNPVSITYTAEAALSDCVLIVRNNKLVWYTWDNDTETFYTIPKTDHTVVIDAAVAATCTESGLTEGSHCSACSEVINVFAMFTVPGP